MTLEESRKSFHDGITITRSRNSRTLQRWYRNYRKDRQLPVLSEQNQSLQILNSVSYLDCCLKGYRRRTAFPDRTAEKQNRTVETENQQWQELTQ